MEEKEKKVEKNEFSQENFGKRQKKFQQGFKALQDKYHLDLEIKLSFPQYNILPADLQLAIAVLYKHDVKYQVSTKELEVKE